MPAASTPPPHPPHPAPPRPTQPAPRRVMRALTLGDLTDDLVWPRLLKAAGLALRPARVGLGLVYLVCVAIVLVTVGAIIGPEQKQRVGVIVGDWVYEMQAAISLLLKLEAGPLATRLYELFVQLPAALLSASPVGVLIATPLILFLTAVFGGAISRSAALESAQGVDIAWPKALGFGLSRWMSLAAAIAIPLLIVWGIALGLHLCGLLLFRFSGLNIVGGLMWPLMLLGGLVASIVVIAFIVGHPLLVPSIACEGTDAIDAVQHAYSFVFARPLRLAIYWLILLGQMALAMLVVGLVLALALQFARAGAAGWSGEGGPRIMSTLPASMLPSDYSFGGRDPLARGADLQGTEKVSAAIVQLVTTVFLLLGYGYLISFKFTASTLLYLAMRRVVDGQAMTEVHHPGVIAGTMAPVEPPPAATAPQRASESVSDTGPADET